MKAFHFCTPEKLKEIKLWPRFDSVRTGWVPELYPGDKIKINERVDKTDTLLFIAKVLSVQPILFKNIDQTFHREEIERYHKKFHPERWFFIITFERVKPNPLDV